MADKTGAGLVGYVKSKLGTAYVYGAKMEVLTRERYDQLKRAYGSLVWDSDVQKVGKMCVDCSGLISAYTGIIRGSSQYRERAKEAFLISTVSKAPPGALVWQQGHIGVYIGLENGVPMCIDAAGSALGVRKAKLPLKFTHWLLCNDIAYPSSAAPNPEPGRAAPNPDPGCDEVLNAIKELVRAGIIASPDYWAENYGNLPHLGRLLVNMADYCGKGR